MLVLSREVGESIQIGDNITVYVVGIRGDKVRLGIEAPSEIPVHKREVFEATQRESLQAAKYQARQENLYRKLGENA